MKDSIAIIDLGGQYCHLIGRRLRGLGVRSRIYGPKTRIGLLSRHAGIILSGGPQSVYEAGSPRVSRDILDLKVPILGICYGHQLLAQMLGAKVERGSGEYGPTRLYVASKDTLFTRLPKEQTVWMSHADTVSKLPPGLLTLASTEQCRVAAFGSASKRHYGVQFHPEVVHTEHGRKILKRFVALACGLKVKEGAGGEIAPLIKKIRARLGKKSVFFLVSGGVDSTVAFALCAKALPKKRILGLHVDTGLMRKGETEDLHTNLSALGLADRLQVIDRSTLFLNELRGVIDPEEKRKIIGRLFVEVQSDAMRRFGIDEKHWLLGQGTIYPDTIESGGSRGLAAVIKTHHNRCPEILELIRKGRVIEPLSEVYKDEVRELGRRLGLSRQLTDGWPFPGPGLAIRCLCSLTGGKAEPADRALSDIVADPNYEIALLPIKSVGVQGDSRTYRRVLALRGPGGRLDYEALQSISVRACNVQAVTNRVVAFVAGNVATMADAVLLKSGLNSERLKLLREADFIVRSRMEEHNFTANVWQFPVVLVPISFAGGETIILRPLNSEDGMTASFARLPEGVLRAMATDIASLPGVDAVFLDVTSKPPATIEWE
ncbi:MAG: glutamine-hydrolyzing GMP synthase [Deltaproteobacteria bacterium]|nr:glutamine-hydrolyzing GMP synthase [Deltaproteobacteria bacterium]